MDYASALAYLESFINYERRPDADAQRVMKLERIEALLSELGQPQQHFPAVHLAGTKGKGSVAALVASMLQAAGLRVGLFTSPHLIDFRERIRLNGAMIPREEVAHRIATRIRPAIAAYQATSAYGPLTFFEVYTALAFDYFAAQSLDFAVVETGLGGRLDATNTVQPCVTAITTLGFDHTAVLGDTLPAIAREKAGIIKPGVPVVSAPQEPEALAVLREVCAVQRAELMVAGEQSLRWARLDSSAAGRTQRFSLQGLNAMYPDLELPLLGEHQLVNAGVAVGVVELLQRQGAPIPSQAIREGLAATSWPGRLQVVRERPWLVLDAAHNCDSARALRQALGQHFAYDRLVVIFGMYADKDAAAFAAELFPAASLVLVARTANNPRAAEPEDLAAQITPFCAEVRTQPSVAAALKEAQTQARATDLICVTGSVAFVGEAMKVLGLEVCEQPTLAGIARLT